MTLTEQYKRGELKQGYYYTKYTPKVGKPFVEIELRNYLLDLAKVRDADTVEVLAPVPSYEEWQELKDEVEIYHNNFKLMKAELERELENQQLKELLKECRGFFVEGTKCDLVSYHKNDLFMMLKKIDNAIGEKK